MKKIINTFCMLMFVLSSVYSANVLTSNEPEIPDGEGNLGTYVIPLQIAIFEPVQIFSKSKDITGLKLNLIYGYNYGTYGIDIGLASKAKDTVALQLNLINIVENTGQGAQLALFNLSEDYSGIQFGLFNLCDSELNGAQAGIFNYAPICTGLQFGLVNSCSSMRGVQIGLVNIIKESNVPFMPIMNMSF